MSPETPDHQSLIDQGSAEEREAFMMRLRDATEEDAAVALRNAKVQLPLTSPYEALEFFNCMIDVLSGQRTADDADDACRIQAGFGSTHI